MTEPLVSSHDARRTVPFHGRIRPIVSTPTCQTARVETINGGLCIFKQGAPLTGIAEILSGTVALSFRLGDGRERIIDMVQAGTLLGANCDCRYSLSAKCVSSVTLEWFALDEFRSSPDLQERASDQLRRHIESLRTHVVVQANSSALERVAIFLLTMTDGTLLNEALVGQHDMADYLDLKNETVCRVIAKLRREEVITADRRGNYRVIDRDGLRQLARLDI